MIELESLEAESQGINARGPIQADGSFVLSTFGKNDGAVEGTHRAIVIPPIDEAARRDDLPPKPILQARFQRYHESPLRFTITPGPNTIAVVVD